MINELVATLEQLKLSGQFNDLSDSELSMLAIEILKTNYLDVISNELQKFNDRENNPFY